MDAVGFEPTTLRVQTERSARWSYAPMTTTELSGCSGHRGTTPAIYLLVEHHALLTSKTPMGLEPMSPVLQTGA